MSVSLIYCKSNFKANIPKKKIVWLYCRCLKKTGLVGQIYFFIYFFYIFGGFEVQKIKWSQTQVFFNEKMVYYTTKVLVRNISWKIIHFLVYFGGKFNAMKFWRKTILGEKLNAFKKQTKKYLGRSCTLGSIGGVQTNNFFLDLIWEQCISDTFSVSHVSQLQKQKLEPLPREFVLYRSYMASQFKENNLVRLRMASLRSISWLFVTTCKSNFKDIIRNLYWTGLLCAASWYWGNDLVRLEEDDLETFSF